METIVGGEAFEGNVPPSSAQQQSPTSMPPTIYDTNEESAQVENNQTAKKIMDLFSEIDSNLCDTVPFNRKFLPCKYCKGSVQDL